MDKHLIVLDLDGTLLTKKQTISPRTKQVLSHLKEEGHEIMIATGRPFRASQLYYQELGLTTPIVNFNGAYVHHPLLNSWEVSHTPFDHKVALEIVEACHDYQFHNIIAEIQDDLYFHYADDKLKDIFHLGNPTVITGDLRKSMLYSPTSMLIHTDEQNIMAIRNHLTDIHAQVIHHRGWGAPFHVVEIVKSGLNKAIGIQKVANYLNISQQNIIAFGDEDNDLEMIEFAGTGVAMGNAIPQLKNLANTITLSNEEDGIALFLEEKFNLKLA